MRERRTALATIFDSLIDKLCVVVILTLQTVARLAPLANRLEEAVDAVMTSGTDMIPDWDYDGVLPANDTDDPTSAVRSPYTVPLFDLIARFGNTQARRNLLRGLLSFRVELHRAGLTRGFQWIDGSFAENVEGRRGRPPNDIDLVTFFYIPDGYTWDALADNFSSLFDQTSLKNGYDVDAYYVQLNQTTSEEIIDESLYWYSLWSHTRGGKWKGYLQIALASDEDEQVRLQLDQMDKDEGGQA